MTDEGPGPEPQEEGDLYDELGGPEEAEAPPLKAQPEVPEPEADIPAVEGAEAADDGSGGHRRPKRAKWPWVFLGLLGLAILTIGWTKTVSTDGYCTTCHTTQQAAGSASRSVHSEVACISCHSGWGVQGAVKYVPTFAREVADQLTPLSIAAGTMDPIPCGDCHTAIFETPLLEGQHPTTGCNECHGNTAHPTPSPSPGPIENPHSADWIDFHGREANRDLESCATCHLLGQQSTQGTCMACHFRGEYPHPKGWIEEHGAVQLEEGVDACTLCHAPTFCEGCHGTEIPHGDDWLGEHQRYFSNNFSPVPCLLCHAQSQCEDCHIRHSIHIQQGLYTGWERNVGT